MHQRILIHLPRDAEAQALQAALGTRHATHVCPGAEQFLAALGQGAAVAFVAEEMLAEPALAGPLARWLESQPSGFDFPFVVIGAAAPAAVSGPDTLAWLGNSVLLERPVEPGSRAVVHAADAAIRARLRQCAVRERQGASGQGGKLEAVGRLTSDIAHEFNNLLHVIKMNLELVSMYATEEKIKPVVERAKTAARRGGKLTSQLLAFARTQAQPLPQQGSRVVDVLTGMKELLEISAGPGVAIQFDLAEGLPPVLGASALELAALNLAARARDTLADGGQLKFSTRAMRRVVDDDLGKAGDYTVLTVSGHGGNGSNGGGTYFEDAVFEYPAAPAADPDA